MEGSNFNYSTHLLGALIPAKNTKHIVVYNTINMLQEYKRISLLNMQEIYDWLIQNEVKLYESVYREEGAVYFDYSHEGLGFPDNQYVSGFNVILYIGDDGSSVLGYTSFSEVNGEYVDLKINLKFNAKLNQFEVDFVVINDLREIKEGEFINKEINHNQVPQDLSKLYNYLTPSNIDTDQELRNYYSRDPRVTIAGDHNSVLYVPGINTTKSYEITEMGIAPVGRDVMVNPYQYSGFSKYNIGYFNDNIVLYLIDNDNLRFSVANIGNSALNSFYQPEMCINLPTSGYIELPSHDPDIKEIKYGAGPYLICEDIEGQTQIYNFRYNEWIDDNYEYGVFVDPFDTTARIRVRYDKELDLPSLLQVYPEIANTHDYGSIFKSTSKYYVLRKIGNWLIVKESIFTLGKSTSKYFVTSPQMTLWVEEDELENLVYLNDSNIMVRNTLSYSGVTYDYYSLYSCSGSDYYSNILEVSTSDLGVGLGTDNFVNKWEIQGKRQLLAPVQYRMLSNNFSSLTPEEKQNWNTLKVCLPGPERINKYVISIETMRWRASLYEDNRVIKYIDINSPVDETPLNDYRKGALPVNEYGIKLSYLPEIIGSYGGYLFYLDELGSTLNYL